MDELISRASELALSARRLTVLYGSQTGTAEDLAGSIARTAERKRCEVTLCSMDEYDPADLIDEELVLFVLATTGQGDFPTSAEEFWRFLLRDGLPADVLGELEFAVFGLGDSSYAKYNWPARKLRRRLRGLGAQEVVEGGEGDDQHYLGIEGTLLPWLDAFWSYLDESRPLPEGVKEVPDEVLLPPKVEVRFLPEDTPLEEPEKPEGWTTVELLRNERMTPTDHFQDVRHLSLSTSGTHTAGDVAYLLPSNPPQLVASLLELLGWAAQADAPLQTTLSPHPTTLRRLMTYTLDPFSVPRRSFFDLLRRFAEPGSLEREKLDEYMQPGEGADEMYEYAMRVRRTMAEVLFEFHAIKVEPRWVGELFPRMRPRAFSIASPGGTGVELAIALVQYKTRLKDPRWGVCSRWIDGLQPGQQVHVKVEQGMLRAPSDPTTPIVLVGPGTGIAPLRAIALTHPGPKILFAGCRFTNKDALFRAELENTPNLDYILAPSRDGDQVYVQQRIREHAARVWQTLSQRGVLYLCGSSGKMPEQVRDAVKHACIEHGEMDDEQAERYLDKMVADGRWQEECWS